VLKEDIEKKGGGTRTLGIPTVTDRIAQMVVKIILEKQIEPIFHKYSYGYRPNKSAINAVGKARERCWKHDWVIDLDIKGFFDNLDHSLLTRAVRKHTNCKWVLMYIERWLKVPVQDRSGNVENRVKGTPQGGVVSPLLANLFLYYTFDQWMGIYLPNVLFERYADDILVHCKSEEEAEWALAQIEQRLNECGLEVHPEKTKIVYCKDSNRNEEYSNISFDFLGYTFRPRRSKNRYGEYFTNFSPAISNKSGKRIRKTIKRWRWHARSDKSLEELSKATNIIVKGWFNYYGKFYKSALQTIVHYLNLNDKLIRWAIRKMKRLKGSKVRARRWLKRVAEQSPTLFTHWQLSRMAEQ
jgi:group II intron reverse transcriptase/maturase